MNHLLEAILATSLTLNCFAQDPKIVVDLSTQTLTLNDQVYPCVVGKRNHSGASVTPKGNYRVNYKSQSTSLIVGDHGKVYGRRYIGLVHMNSGRSNIGIHGTNHFNYDKRFQSLGCVRLKNEVIEDKVYDEVEKGDIVKIR